LKGISIHDFKCDLGGPELTYRVINDYVVWKRKTKQFLSRFLMGRKRCKGECMQGGAEARGNTKPTILAACHAGAPGCPNLFDERNALIYAFEVRKTYHDL
jgi:hypothetical protein